ncbi:membrane-bound lytic murein transglycosylase A [Methylobacillus rhizosphaerae]|uniref:peptidoglycan lytic exotransglycosylase n=1 Tax=Methylobacillus rhizosphaerae TaxID=551994 RepID=A0A238Z775_9PROT|nr:murein transglycosylase A [Methylobacillus rhizosphaerae]SNR79276.1 membrane-bound lytic murein transglycosylase A [Methylobacillus rhizosphaerae]
MEETPSSPPCQCPPVPVEPAPAPSVPPPPEKQPVSKVPDYGLLKPARWEDLAGLPQSQPGQAWAAWLQGCSTLRNRQPWREACDAAVQLPPNPGDAAVLAYFKQYFSVYQASNQDGSDTGMITGYYEPMLKGSRVKSAKYQYPLYGRPDDLITVELASLFPELAGKRVRGRLEGNKLIPYYDRAEIEAGTAPVAGHELLWVDDPVELFFLQVQGSGLIKLDNGESVHIGYADQNGMSYQSIGKVLVERGELTLDKASMQGIKQWARKNPAKLQELLNTNPSYVFFRELPANLPGPLGALGVPILSERVLAVDPKFIPLGAPVFLTTTYPNSSKPLNRVMMAQDTGGAIKGGVRADFFWGAGDAAGKQAGSMKQDGRMWVLLPKGFPLPAAK